MTPNVLLGIHKMIVKTLRDLDSILYNVKSIRYLDSILSNVKTNIKTVRRFK